MPIKSGRYIITNVRQRNLVTLLDPNDGTPLTAADKKSIPDEQWVVELRSNGRYFIRNGKHMDSFANVGYRAEPKAAVEGRSREQYWLIQETCTERQYTIRPTDSQLFWALEDGEVGTSITLHRSPTDLRCWWTFEDAETGSAAEINKGTATMNYKWNIAGIFVIIGIIWRVLLELDATIPNRFITGHLSIVQLEFNVIIPNLASMDDPSNSQPELGATILDFIIPEPLSSSLKAAMKGRYKTKAYVINSAT